METVFEKDPNATLDYQWDWTDWLTDTEVIDTFTVTIVPAEVAPIIGLDLGITLNTGKTVTAWLSGGTLLVHYEVTCSIVTSEDRIDERTIYIICVDR
jgi:hypothetical protein